MPKITVAGTKDTTVQSQSSPQPEQDRPAPARVPAPAPSPAQAPSQTQTQAVEDYLKAVWEIQQEHEQGQGQGQGASRRSVTTTALAERLALSPGSVTGMVKKLAEMGLVRHEPYQGVVLTPPGERIALEVLRHHRLIELYLAEALGVPWDQVHAEAEKWEHVLSEDLEARIDARLGFPTTDPHGAPIPSRSGALPPLPRRRLIDVAAGDAVRVAEVSDDDPAVLRYLGGLGVVPRASMQVVAVAPFNGPITIRCRASGGTSAGIAEQALTDVALGREVAAQVWVEEAAPEPRRDDVPV